MLLDQSYNIASIIPEVFLNNREIFFLLLLVLLFTGFIPELSAQWVNDPAQNSRIVLNTSNPINISSVQDRQGGAFIFWEDTRDDKSNIYFQHTDANGSISFRADGKTVSTLMGMKKNPVAAPAIQCTAAVVWKDYTLSNSGNLYIQKVANNGSLLWGNSGIQLTVLPGEVFDYSIETGERNNIYTAFIKREEGFPAVDNLYLQKITQNGEKLYDNDGLFLYSSRNKLNHTTIVADRIGGVFVLWLESENTRTRLMAQYVTSDGKINWENNHIIISSLEYSVINYNAIPLKNSSLYISWQAIGKERNIYHQIINKDRVTYWGKLGNIAVEKNGNQSNPQPAESDSSIVLSWINETNNNRTVFVQKFDTNGIPLWKNSGLPAVTVEGSQFGQKIIEDKRSGVILAWIDKRLNDIHPNIFAQRIDKSGTFMWDSLGIDIASYYNSEKSYLSLIPDERGGAVAFFKENRDGLTEIYGQKIFSNGRFISEILAFDAVHRGDSIQITWYTVNEMNSEEYRIERTVQSDTGELVWKSIGNVKAQEIGKTNFYEIFDFPDVNGILYYRAALSDKEGNTQYSEIKRVNHIIGAEKILVAQNVPNPFSESTVIKFNLPVPGKVTIEFFNDKVEKINEISENYSTKGEHSITFYSEGLAAGVYFFKYRFKDFVEVKKMVIVR